MLSHRLGKVVLILSLVLILTLPLMAGGSVAANEQRNSNISGTSSSIDLAVSKSLQKSLQKNNIGTATEEEHIVLAKESESVTEAELTSMDIPYARNVNYEKHYYYIWLMVFALCAAALIGVCTYKYQMGRSEE